jgi:DNA-binding transcriptional MerR regulator
LKNYTISKLARSFGLSRSTLLYYDRIGLLRPSGRSNSGYRLYTDREASRLKRISTFRQAGLSLRDIEILLSSGSKPSAMVLEKRLGEIGSQILDLRSQQRLLSEMLKKMAGGGCPATVDKKMWVEMLRAAGMDDEAMANWHDQFEARAPEAHHEFLISLGIPEKEVIRIRGRTRPNSNKSTINPNPHLKMALKR